MITMPFQSLAKYPSFLFFLFFLQLMKEKHPEVQGGSGFLQGLSQSYSLKPTEPGLVWDEYRHIQAVPHRDQAAPAPRQPVSAAGPSAGRQGTELGL